MDVKCSECGNKVYTLDKCWHIIGFPSWHPRLKRQPQNQMRGGRTFTQGPRNSRSKSETQNWREAAQVEVEPSVFSYKQSPTLTAQQVEQLLKLLPPPASSNYSSGTKFSSETDEKIDVNFTGNVTLLSVIYHKHDWILEELQIKLLWIFPCLRNLGDQIQIVMFPDQMLRLLRLLV